MSSKPASNALSYFGPALAATEERPIEVVWPDAWSVRVRIEGVLAWDTSIEPSASTRLMTAVASHLPDALWGNRAVLSAMSRMAGPTLRAGAIRLQGRVPSDQWFRVKIGHVWTTTNVVATLRGEDLGPAGPAPTQRWLGGFALPNRGLFAAGQATFESYRPDRHLQTLPHSP